MTDARHDLDERDLRVAAALYCPPSPGTRLERATRMRDIFLTLLHAYGVPTMLNGWMIYDFGLFEVDFFPPTVWLDDKMRLIVHECDFGVVLDISWNEAGDVSVRKFSPSWWEVELGDINFWDSRVSWAQNANAVVPYRADCLNDGVADTGLSHVAKRMDNLRVNSARFARRYAELHFGIGDRERGEKWWQLYEIVCLGPQDLPSSCFN